MLSRENADIAAAYDLWAGSYDTDPNRTRDLAGEVLRRSGLRLAGRTVVEIGCGTGLNTIWLSRHAERVLAMDLSAGMLRQARARVKVPNARLVRHDIRRPWPCAEASADLVLATLVLEHVERLEPVFQETARVLRAGGELLVCELHPMRQRLGRQAQLTHPRTGERMPIAAFLHDVSDYVDEGQRAGFRLLGIGEWRDEGTAEAEAPRLLSVVFELGGNPSLAAAEPHGSLP